MSARPQGLRPFIIAPRGPPRSAALVQAALGARVAARRGRAAPQQSGGDGVRHAVTQAGAPGQPAHHLLAKGEDERGARGLGGDAARPGAGGSRGGG